MNCLFCEKPESFFVELHLWDGREQRVRELLLAGVCVAHRESATPHPNVQKLYELYPVLKEARLDRLIGIHQAQFAAEKGARYITGMAFFAYDSHEGKLVRSARGGHTDKTKTETHGPKIDVSILPDADFDEAVAASVTKN